MHCVMRVLISLLTLLASTSSFAAIAERFFDVRATADLDRRVFLPHGVRHVVVPLGIHLRGDVALAEGKFIPGFP